MRPAALTVRTAAVAGAAAVVGADRLTKAWAERALADGPVPLGLGVQLRLVENPGAAFGLLQGAGSLLALAAVVAAGVIFVSFRSAGRVSEALPMGLILGGAVGNLIDRVTRGPGLADGWVVDWIDLGWWPVFNLADAAITVGALWLAVGALRRS